MFLTLFVALAEVFVPVVSDSAMRVTRGSFPMKWFSLRFEIGAGRTLVRACTNLKSAEASCSRQSCECREPQPRGCVTYDCRLEPMELIMWISPPFQTLYTIVHIHQLAVHLVPLFSLLRQRRYFYLCVNPDC